MIDARTTSLLVYPITPEKINLHNQILMRYTLPSTYYARDKNKKDKFYGKVQNEIAEQLDEPYYFFTKDRPLPAVYALVSQPQPPDICLPDLSSEPLRKEIISADDVRLHILLKVLSARYIKSRREDIFTSQGKHYIQVEGSGNWLTCLELEIKGINDEGEAVRTFHVLSHARQLRRFGDSKPSAWRVARESFYGKMAPKGGRVVFRALKRSEVLNYSGELFSFPQKSQVFQRRPTKRDFHALGEPETTHGGQLHKFIQGFTTFLLDYGLKVEQKRYQLKKYQPLGKKYELPRSELQTVYVLDNRLNKGATRVEKHMAFSRESFPELSFDTVTQERLSPKTPTLVLQDYNKEDFAPEGKLSGQDDPKRKLYASTKKVAKQTINVATETGNDYLERSTSSAETKAFRRNLTVCLDELFLKFAALGHVPSSCLPLFHHEQTSLSDYVFIRRGVYGVDRERHTVAMWTEEEKLRFVDVGKPNGKQALQKQLERHNVNWLDDIFTKFDKYHYLPNGEKEPASYDLIVI